MDNSNSISYEKKRLAVKTVIVEKAMPKECADCFRRNIFKQVDLYS